MDDSVAGIFSDGRRSWALSWGGTKTKVNSSMEAGSLASVNKLNENEKVDWKLSHLVSSTKTTYGRTRRFVCSEISWAQPGIEQAWEQESRGADPPATLPFTVRSSCRRECY